MCKKYSCEEDLLSDKDYLNELLPNFTHIIKVMIPDGEEYKNTRLDKKDVFNHSEECGSFGIKDWLFIKGNSGCELKEVNNNNEIGKKYGFIHPDGYRYFVLKFFNNVENAEEEIKKFSVVFLDENREISSVRKLTLDFGFPVYEIILKINEIQSLKFQLEQIRKGIDELKEAERDLKESDGYSFYFYVIIFLLIMMILSFDYL